MLRNAANIGTTVSKYVFTIKNYPKFLATTSKKVNASLKIIDVSSPVFIVNSISTKMNSDVLILTKMTGMNMKTHLPMTIMTMSMMKRKTTMKMTILRHLRLRPLKRLRKLSFVLKSKMPTHHAARPCKIMLKGKISPIKNYIRFKEAIAPRSEIPCMIIAMLMTW